ncbi:hypothetical protein HMPREF9380_2096 [Streptococcus sanguinis SK49]|uniref:Uncharacterized protein n=1 Tax=Streptococcus sanguinis SK49 TaxID=888808 RepID=F3V006_STRSA|nr:hypothetical protein HMPREF9380_2096 [Streptococcus sanguinis SK49]
MLKIYFEFKEMIEQKKDKTNKKALKPRLFLIYFYAPCMNL